VIYVIKVSTYTEEIEGIPKLVHVTIPEAHTNEKRAKARASLLRGYYADTSDENLTHVVTVEYPRVNPTDNV
jgi:hypothetical protein